MTEPAPRGSAVAARRADPAREGALIAAILTACGVLLPLLLVGFGADYLAPRNLIGAMVPLTALIAVMATARGTGIAGAAIVAVIAAGFLVISVDVDLSPRLQRGDWRALAAALRSGPADRAITTVELGSAPLRYYLPGLHELHPGTSAVIGEIDETGYSPLRESAGQTPAPGFRLLSRRSFNGLILYRFVSASNRPVAEAALRRHVITLAQSEVLVPSNVSVVR